MDQKEKIDIINKSKETGKKYAKLFIKNFQNSAKNTKKLKNYFSELKKLSVEDICSTIYMITNFANQILEETGSIVPLKEYEDSIYTMYEIIIDKIKNLDNIWVIIENDTKCPFLNENNEIYIFTNKTYINIYTDYVLKLMNDESEIPLWTFQSVKKENIKKFLINSGYSIGVDAFCINPCSFTGCIINTENMINKPKNKKNLKEQIKNPVMFRTAIKIKQEYIKSKNSLLNNNLMEELEDAIISAKVIIPVQIKKDGLASINLLILEYQEYKLKSLPIFTDIDEFNKFYPNKKNKPWIWDADKLTEFDFELGVINPGSVNLGIQRDWFE